MCWLVVGKDLVGFGCLKRVLMQGFVKLYLMAYFLLFFKLVQDSFMLVQDSFMLVQDSKVLN
jgi:hypothetical protein